VVERFLRKGSEVDEILKRGFTEERRIGILVEIDIRCGVLERRRGEGAGLWSGGVRKGQMENVEGIDGILGTAKWPGYYRSWGLG
jgi:hypothetical protein